MNILKNDNSGVTVEITKNETVILNNALNEICNGSYAIDEIEFQTLVGATKKEVVELLEELNKLLVLE